MTARPTRRRRGDLARGVRWYLGEVAGEGAYDRYVQLVRREHPGAMVMSPGLRALAAGRSQRQPRARCC